MEQAPWICYLNKRRWGIKREPGVSWRKLDFEGLSRILGWRRNLECGNHNIGSSGAMGHFSWVAASMQEGYKDVIIETDSHVVISFLQGSGNSGGGMDSLVNKHKEFLKTD